MENFVRDHAEFVAAVRRSLLRDLAQLRLLGKEDMHLRPVLKHRIRMHLRDLDTSRVLFEWALERPDDADAFTSKV
jgi:hypothetical protein